MSNWEEDEYLDLLHTVMNTGEKRDQERTGTGTRSIFFLPPKLRFRSRLSVVNN